jgi:membrane protease YdiL (CAAX protease family)
MADLEHDLPTAMIAAAFAGISWYIGIELNVRLCVSSIRRTGLYFLSVLACSWGALSQPVLILLVNFGIWKPSPGSITAIYLSWWILVIPQSFVLYSRLHLFISEKKLRWVLYLIVFNTIVLSIPTVVVGVLAVSLRFLVSNMRSLKQD